MTSNNNNPKYTLPQNDKPQKHHSTSPLEHSNGKKLVAVSFDEGQLKEDQDIEDVDLRTVQSSVEIEKQIDVSASLPHISIKSNKSSIIPRNSTGRQQRVTTKKPYSEPRSEKGDDNFSEDNVSQTKSQIRQRNIFVSLGIGALCGLGIYYASGQNKKWGIIATVGSIFGTFAYLSH